MWFSIVIAALTGYMLGNLNGAVCVSQMISGKDVRKEGSGNAGLTNFVRVFGVGKASLVIVIDLFKAMLACLVGGLLLSPYGYAMEGRMLGAVCVSLGHDFPALLGFRGGKGILSALGAILMVDWLCAVIMLTLFILIVAFTRYVSLGSILAASGLAVWFCVFHNDRIFVMLGALIMVALAIFMHRANILRLIRGKENKLSLSKK